MTVPRNLLVDPSVTRYYHCISRCVRRAMLCGDGFEYRKQWIEDRLEVLSGAFAISVCGFAVLDNHLHLLVRLDPDLVEEWSDLDVVRRWFVVFPPKNKRRMPIEVCQEWLAAEAKKKKKVDTYRKRLQNLGWFMKSLKEPLSRMANKEDGCKGAFWEGRYKSIALLDEESLLAVCTYIDLNVFAAGLVAMPEENSPHTSLRQRLEHVRSKGGLSRLRLARKGNAPASRALGNIEQDHWLCPLQDRRRMGATREGMLEGITIGSYLMLIDATSRMVRDGKSHVDKHVASIFDRLGTTSDFWQVKMQRLIGRKRTFGSFFSATRQRLRELAGQIGLQRLANVNGCRAG